MKSEYAFELEINWANSFEKTSLCEASVYAKLGNQHKNSTATSFTHKIVEIIFGSRLTLKFVDENNSLWRRTLKLWKVEFHFQKTLYSKFCFVAIRSHERLSSYFISLTHINRTKTSLNTINIIQRCIIKLTFASPGNTSARSKCYICYFASCIESVHCQID